MICLSSYFVNSKGPISDHNGLIVLIAKREGKRAVYITNIIFDVPTKYKVRFLFVFAIGCRIVHTSRTIRIYLDRIDRISVIV